MSVFTGVRGGERRGRPNGPGPRGGSPPAITRPGTVPADPDLSFRGVDIGEVVVRPTARAAALTYYGVLAIFPALLRAGAGVTPGSLLALLIWMIASAGFAFYVANFASYTKTYGTVAGVVVFLGWLRITNLAVLLGLEFDAELARQRAIAGGLPRDEEP